MMKKISKTYLLYILLIFLLFAFISDSIGSDEDKKQKGSQDKVRSKENAKKNIWNIWNYNIKLCQIWINNHISFFIVK